MISPFDCDHKKTTEEDLEGEVVDICKSCGLVMPQLAPEFQQKIADDISIEARLKLKTYADKATKDLPLDIKGENDDTL